MLGDLNVPYCTAILVNDLPDVSNLETTLFANDTNLHISHENIKIPQSEVINEIKKINMWIKLDELTISHKKLLYLVGKKSTNFAKNFEVGISYHRIESKNSIKYLAIQFHKGLSWKFSLIILLKSFLKFAE